MEIKSASTGIKLGIAPTAVDNAGSDEDGRKRDLVAKSNAQEAVQDTEEESVKIYISAAGMRISKSMESSINKDDALSPEEVEEMYKKMEGLSSQVINGHFSLADKASFQKELNELNLELNRLNGEGISFSRVDNVQLSHRISDLTRKISEAALYRRSANAFFVVKSQQAKANLSTKLNIAI